MLKTTGLMLFFGECHQSLQRNLLEKAKVKKTISSTGCFNKITDADILRAFRSFKFHSLSEMHMLRRCVSTK